MKTLYRSTLGLIGALALAGATFAQVPSTNDTSDAYSNTGMGMGALANLIPGTPPTGGNVNTASGYEALLHNTTGCYNTATGSYAMEDNQTGCDNTATGAGALQANNASYNAASGAAALYRNTAGNYNTGIGAGALTGAAFTVGNPNGATGSNNTGIGYNALNVYSTGHDNTASGD